MEFSEWINVDHISKSPGFLSFILFFQEIFLLSSSNASKSIQNTLLVIFINSYFYSGNVIACASVQFANPSVTDTTQDSYFHWLTFLFVHKEFQLYGYGRNILSIISVEIFNDCNRPLRVESARKAVNFFMKCDFKQICTEPKECVAGSGYFKFLFLMEKNCYSNKEEVWDD